MSLIKSAKARSLRQKWRPTHGIWRKRIVTLYALGCMINLRGSIAGGETTGSLMASITYFLLTNPEVYRKLNDEVRTAYTRLDDIDVASTTNLKYLMAVLKEGMRIFPVAPQGAPRVSPGVTVEGHYVPKGVRLDYKSEIRDLPLTILSDRILCFSLGRYA